MQPLTGKFYTYFSTKVRTTTIFTFSRLRNSILMFQWTLLTFFFVFEIGSVICGAAQSSEMLIIGRAVAGLGCSGLINGMLTVIVGAIAPPKRPCMFSPLFRLNYATPPIERMIS